jgi:hypothetical protein
MQKSKLHVKRIFAAIRRSSILPFVLFLIYAWYSITDEMRGVILSEAKNLPYGGQMFRLRLNMTTHQNTYDEPLVYLPAGIFADGHGAAR